MQACQLVLMLGLAGLAVGAAIADKSQYSWELFKEIYGKSYENMEEEAYRKMIFEDNIKIIKEHNRMFISGLKTFSMAVNHLTDKLHSEVFGSGLLKPEGMRSSRSFGKPAAGAAPASIDWREVDGVVTPVKNQGHCGSCWAFSATGSIEGQMMLKKNVSVSLSESQLVDCDVNGCLGCRGGWIPYAFDYVKEHGLESEEDYPYKAENRDCQYDQSKVVANITGYTKLEMGSEEVLTTTVGTVGPVSVAIWAGSAFRHYNEGVLYDPDCEKEDWVNHGVLVVGYGHDDNSDMDFYIVKNSWGPEWGEHGYVKMARNQKNNCNIADFAVSPHV